MKGYNTIKLKRFRKLEFVLGIILLPCLVSCGAIFDLLAGTTANAPLINYSDCWRSTTPFNGEYYVQRAIPRGVKSDNSNYRDKNILVRVEIDQSGKEKNPGEDFQEDELLILYANPNGSPTAFSEVFVEVAYQLESQTAEVLERGVMKYNLKTMTVEDELSGQTYNMSPCDSFKNN